MQIYLPIANMSVNILTMILLGGTVGLLSGMFGVGGGFLTTPLLIFFGIPPTVAAASAATQVTGASVSGVLAHWERGGVDLRMGLLLAAGGVVGALVGAWLFNALSGLGQIDTAINILYVAMLGSIGWLMARDAWRDIRAERSGEPVQVRKVHHHPLVANLPFRWRFYKSGIYVSPLAPLALGIFICESGHGCDPILIDHTMTGALQRSDPRCGPPVAQSGDWWALWKLRAIVLVAWLKGLL